MKGRRVVVRVTADDGWDLVGEEVNGASPKVITLWSQWPEQRGLLEISVGARPWISTEEDGDDGEPGELAGVGRSLVDLRRGR